MRMLVQNVVLEQLVMPLHGALSEAVLFGRNGARQLNESRTKCRDHGTLILSTARAAPYPWFFLVKPFGRLPRFVDSEDAELAERRV